MKKIAKGSSEKFILLSSFIIILSSDQTKTTGNIFNLLMVLILKIFLITIDMLFDGRWGCKYLSVGVAYTIVIIQSRKCREIYFYFCCFFLKLFWLFHVAMWNLSSLTRDRTCALAVEA